MKSYKVTVTLYKDEEKVDNGLRFIDKAEAEAYGRDLYRRWLAVKTFDVIPVDDEPNAHFPSREGDFKPEEPK